MIRINLMPFRAARARENIRKQVSIFFLLIALFGFVLVYLDLAVQKKIVSLESRVAWLQKEKKGYDDKVRQVNRIKKQLKTLDQKIAAIKDLETLRRKPVVFFDRVPEILIPGRMWLTGFDYSLKSVKFNGVALDNKTVADFMTSIEESGFFNSVNLTKTEHQKIGGRLKLKKFEIVSKKIVLAKQTNKKAKK